MNASRSVLRAPGLFSPNLQTVPWKALGRGASPVYHNCISRHPSSLFLPLSLCFNERAARREQRSSSGKLVSGLVYARDRRCCMNYGCIGYPAALADARVFPRFPDFQTQRTCFYTWLEKELFQARKTLDNIRGFWQAWLRINRLNRSFYEEKKIDFIGLFLL